MYHGGGGFIHSEVYNMPTWMRRFHFEKISEHNKKQNEELEKIEQPNKQSNKLSGPNINPNSVYDF